ncbi:MAG: hypothetical protein Q9169_003127 [Polycauliona sp. 2 TL-2023]
MAANRDERLLMRQRGAGTRDINLTFDLQLPGVPTISRSPLKPQKSGRLQSDPQKSRATRQTPKAKPHRKLVAKGTSVTLSNATPRSVSHGDNVERPEASTSNNGSKAPRHSFTEVSTRKRKIDPNLPEGPMEDAELPPTKRRKKRKSIGQGSIRKKTRDPLFTKQTIRQPKQGTESKKIDAPGPGPMELVSEHILQPPGVSPESGLVQVPEESLNVAPVAKEPKRRKRKSVGQIQRPKKTLRYTNRSMVNSSSKHLEQQQIPVDNVDSIVGQRQVVESPKPQRRKRNDTMESSKRLKSPLQPLPSLHPAAHTSNASNSDTIQDQPIPTIDAAKQPKKRERKPKIVLKDVAKPPNEASSLPNTDHELQVPQGEPPESEEQPELRGMEPEANDASPVLKQPRKKRKPIGQAPKLKRKPASRPLRAIDPNVKLASERMTKTRRTAAAISPPIPQGASHSENLEILPPKKCGDQMLPERQSTMPAAAPKKRGRPKKVQADPQEQPLETEPVQSEPVSENPTSAPAMKPRGRPKKAQAATHAHGGIEVKSMRDEAEPAKASKSRGGPTKRVTSASKPTPLEASKPSNGDAVPTHSRKRRGKNVTQPSVQEDHPEAVPGALEAPITEQEHKAPSPVPVKKRGRPKKQVANPPIAEDMAQKNSSSRLQRNKDQSNDAPSRLTAIDDPKPTAKPATVQHVIDDVDDDPLSECTPPEPNYKAKSNPARSRIQKRPQPLKAHKVTTSDHSDLNEAPAIKVTKRRTKAPIKESFPLKQNPEPVAHPNANVFTEPSDFESPAASPQPRQHQLSRETDLDSHIEQSLLEENALKADLKELQAQQAQEIEEEKEYDRQMQSERMSASANKQAALALSDRVPHDEPMVAVKRKARGLENLFRTVSGTRKGSAGDIDPDLQGILDQVKGVAGRGGGITKIL